MKMVKYDGKLKRYAAANGMGLYTLEWVDPGGFTVTEQGLAGPNMLAHVHKVMQNRRAVSDTDPDPEPSFFDFEAKTDAD